LGKTRTLFRAGVSRQTRGIGKPLAGPVPDAALVRRCLEGDQGAYAALIERYQRIAINLAYQMAGNAQDAEDIAQEGFVAAYNTLHRLRRAEYFRAYLMRIVINRALRWRRGREAACREHQAAGAGPDPYLVLSSTLVRQGIARLPGRLRAVLVLRELQGLSYEEIAEVVGVPVNTVRSRLHAARVQLRRALGARIGGGERE